MSFLAPRLGFRVQSVYKLKKPSVLHVARQRLSFLIASLSLFAFVVGNMVGQHGVYSFWRSVLGKEDDQLIAFVGTVPPIAKIPLYSEWSKYGGSKQLHMFSQVPEHILRPMPSYDQATLTDGTASAFSQQVYSTLWKGGYNSPNGSHAGVDIDAPRGTPVVSIANGVVERVTMGLTGFGHFVMIRHPNVPDAGSEGGVTTLRSTYAHMDEVLAREGEVVHKGQQIGTVGNTGLVFGPTGYHLYFEIDRENAPYHPYWPFTSDEAASHGMTYVQAVNSPKFQDRLDTFTLNPMAFVQQYQGYAQKPVVASEAAPSGRTNVQADLVASIDRSLPPALRLRQVAAGRLRSRMAKAGLPAAAVPTVVGAVSAPTSSATPVVTDIVKTASVDEPSSPPVSASLNTDVHHLSIDHSGVLTRTWQKIRISALDAQGNLVRSPSFSGRLYVLSDFGDAEIRPAELSPLDFVNGVATLHVLARNQNKPVFIITRGAFESRSAPMVPTR